MAGKTNPNDGWIDVSPAGANDDGWIDVAPVKPREEERPGLINSITSAAVRQNEADMLEAAPEANEGGDYVARGGAAGLASLLSVAPKVFGDVYNTFFGLSRDEAQILGVDQPKTLGKVGEDVARGLQEKGTEIVEGASEGAKEKYDRLEYLTADPGKSALLSPTRVARDLLQSLPSTLALAVTARFSGGASKDAYEKALTAGATEAVAKKAAIDAAMKTATKVGAASEGTLGYSQQALAIEEKVNKLPREEIEKSPEYQALLKKGKTPEVAQQIVASQAGRLAGFLGGTVDAATNLASGPVLGKIIGEGGSLLSRAGKGAATEAAQETVQSGGEQLGANYSERALVNPDQSLTEGVAEAAAQGAVLGGITGGAATGMLGRNQEDEAESLINSPPDAGVDAYVEQRAADIAGLPEGDPRNAPSAVAPIAESVITPEKSAVVVDGAEIPAAQAPQAPISKILDAGSVEDAIAAASQTAVAAPTGKAATSLDEMIDQTRQMFDEQISNPKQEKLLKLFNGLNVGTIEKAKDGLYEYKTNDGGRFPLQVWAPDPKNPDAGGISPELAKAQIEHYKQIGIDVVYIRDDAKIPFDGVVDPSQPNTIFLSSNPTRNAAQVGQHEVTHVFEGTVLPDGTSLADLMSQQIAEGVTNEGLEHAYTLFGETAPDRASFPNTPEGQAAHADAVLAHLFTELGADIGGEAPKFEGFIQRVMDAVETRYGGGVAAETFKKFMNGIREAITTLRSFFGKGDTQSQKWVTNLETVHGTLAQMYAAKYGEVAGLPEAQPAAATPTAEEVIAEAENAPVRVGPKPREGYDEAKQQASVYKRWLGELDEKRRADADKSPEVAALRAEEKEIISKVRDERYLTKTKRTRLARIRADLEDRLNPKEDNEDMALVRARMVEAQQRMADAAAVTKEKTAEAPKSKPASGEPVRIGKPAPRAEETGNPTEGDRFVANQMAQDTGKPVQFSPKQRETPGFVKWFGGSKVVDKDGKPLVVYHGSDQKFDAFDMRRDAKRWTTFSERTVQSQGAFFSMSRDDAASYGKNVMPVYLSVQRPIPDLSSIPVSSRSSKAELDAIVKIEEDIEYILSPLIEDGADGSKWIDTDGGVSSMKLPAEGWASRAVPEGLFDWAWLDNAEVVARMKERGYDGARAAEPNDQSGISWFVVSPAQIKSATDNSGAFDPKDLRIQFSPKQTKTAAFKKWFGDSEIVDSHGAPLVLYHGTASNIDEIRPSRSGFYGSGIYLTPDPEMAADYADDASYTKGGTGENIVPVYVRMERPYRYNAPMAGMSLELAHADLLRDVIGGKAAERVIRRTANGDGVKFGSQVRNALKEAGHDGIIISGYNIGGNEYVVFDSDQIKSAVGNFGTFDPNDPRIQFSPKVEKPGPVFFSALERAVDGVKFDKAPPGQWLATIKNMTGVKAEEIKTTGIDKWLGQQTRPVTKAEVIDQLQLNAVQITEVEKGGVIGAAEEAEYDELRTQYRAEMEDMPQAAYDRMVALERTANSTENLTKFEQYRLPGGENYRELLLTLPEGEKTSTVKLSAEMAKKYGRQDWLQVASEEDRDAFNAAYKKQGDEMRAAGTFKSGHWNEPNVLAHIRFDERTGPNGERIMHVAEIQSDWHQKGRREGYKPSTEELKARQAEVRELNDKFDELQQDYRREYNTLGRLGREATGDAYDAVAYGKQADKLRAVTAEYHAAEDAFSEAQNAYVKLATGVPDAPFKKTWHELAFKRALRYAAENGYDRLTWDTGDTNNDRYDLSQQVSRISWAKRRDGTYDVSAYDLDGETIVMKDRQNPEQLASIIGKEPTDRIINEDGREKKWAGDTSIFVSAGKLVGDNLKVGGEGMRGFYDKILPDFVNKHVKQWGAKVERSTVGNSSDRYGVATVGTGYRVMDYDSPNNDYVSPEFRTQAGAQAWIDNNSVNAVPVHSINITPAMRKDVMAGQPQFSPKAKPTVKDLQKEVPGLKKVVANLAPDEVAVVSQRTADKLVKLFSDLPSSEETAAVAYSGRAKRGWYKHSADAIVDVFGVEDAPRFAALLAALSPQTSVESNLENALRMWVNWTAAGRPTDTKAINKLLGESVQGTGGEDSVLDAWRGNSVRALTDVDPGRPDFILSGPKVNSFAQNLRNNVNEVTNDAWMATFAGIEGEALAARRLENKVDNVGKSFGFKSPSYIAMSAMVRDAAKILTRRTGQTWTPAEVQETVWSWAKTLYERRDRAGEYRTAEQILRAADMTHEDVTSTPDFAVLLTRGIYRKILEGGNYGSAIASLEKSGEGDRGSQRLSGPATSVTGAEGSGFAQSAFEKHLQRAAKRLERVRTDRLAAKGVNPRELIADARDSEIAANMSAATNSIPGIAQLAAAANAGDESAARLVNLIAHESLERLIATVPDAKLEVSRNGGLYGGSLEPSLGVKITFPEKRRGGVLAALAKFASNFNQEQIHVRQPTIDPAGRVSADGSYSTDVYEFWLESPLTRAEIEQVIAESGLYGLNFSDKKLEAYFVGDPRDDAARAEFHNAIERARNALGDRTRRVEHSTARLWAYGIGEGATAGYDAINGDVPRGTSDYTEIPRAIAERDLGREVEASDQADEITEAQRLLQSKIADHYEQLPDNDMSNPDVRRAYEELAKEIQKQFTALPIKVDIWDQAGEPYKSSADMRRDVLDNNHMWIFGTSVDTFGPPGANFDGHPLLELTGRQSDNGYPLFVNDELRAVHDYYAHMLSPATFGPRGEEAAWKNHLATIDNPWARWALTSETRGQNSWVNFGAHVDPTSKLSERPFARQKAALLPMEHMLTGNDAIDGPTYEFMRTMPDYIKNGSLPRDVNDPFADFSPRVPSSLREKLIRKDPAYKAMFNEPKKQLAIAAPQAISNKAPVVELPPVPEKEPRRRALQPIAGTGDDRFRAINGEIYSVGEEAPQIARAARMVDEEPEKALAVAMLQERAPAGVHPEFFYMALEEAAQAKGDFALLERLSQSRIADEATTMGQRIAAWRNRMEISPLDAMQKVRQAREQRSKSRGIDAEAKIDEVVEQARTASRRLAKSTKRASLNDMIMQLVCKT